MNETIKMMSTGYGNAPSAIEEQHQRQERTKEQEQIYDTLAATNVHYALRKGFSELDAVTKAADTAIGTDSEASGDWLRSRADRAERKVLSNLSNHPYVMQAVNRDALEEPATKRLIDDLRAKYEEDYPEIQQYRDWQQRQVKRAELLRTAGK